MKKPFFSRAWVLVVLAVLLAAAITMAAGANMTDSDPLISLSYLTGKFRTAILGDVQKTADASAQTMQQQIESRASQLTVSDPAPTATATHQTITLKAGETLRAEQGKELLLLSGGATADANGLTDVTAGSAVAAGGVLTVNHLHLATQTVTVTATESAQILIG